MKKIRTILREVNEKHFKQLEQKGKTSLKYIRRNNKQPRFIKIWTKEKIKPPVIKQTIDKSRLILKELGYKFKKTKDLFKLKKLQRALRAKVLQLSYVSDINGIVFQKYHDLDLKKTSVGILRSKIINSYY